MATFGSNLTNLEVLFLQGGGICTLPHNPGSLASAISAIVRNTRPSLQRLDIVAEPYYRYTDCLVLIRDDLGAQLRSFVLSHTDRGDMFARQTVERGANLRSALAHFLPTVVDVDVSSQFKLTVYASEGVSTSITHSTGMQIDGSLRAAIIARPGEYMQQSPAGLLPHHQNQPRVTGDEYWRLLNAARAEARVGAEPYPVR